MKRFLINIYIISLSLLTVCRCMAQDVRNCSWGMSIDQVKNAEGTEPVSNSQEVIGGSSSRGKLYSDKVEVTFRAQIGTKPVEIDYYFVANKLISAKMRLYFNQYYNDSDYSAANRLIQFGDVFRKFSKTNGYITDKYFTKGNYFSSRQSPDNRLCFQTNGFEFISLEEAKNIQSCLSGRLASSDAFYGVGASGLRTNVFISFPPIASAADTFMKIIGWVEYEPKKRIQTRDF